MPKIITGSDAHKQWNCMLQTTDHGSEFLLYVNMEQGIFFILYEFRAFENHYHNNFIYQIVFVLLNILESYELNFIYRKQSSRATK